ncbi:hypothetical protein P12x_001103 [Tundrisphaera lichenicola]|uniref:hypothetical protein n=1 Tax=Tundrisphaera lichenicola TaxID=2029860 RepID=UPI003EBCC494
MIEAEWLAYTDPRPMLGPLRRGASDRKLRLFAAACCRRIWDLLPDEQCRSALKTAELFADGLANLKSLREARRGAMLSYFNHDDHDECSRFTGQESAAMAVAGACWTEAEECYRGLDDVMDNCYGLGRLTSGWRNGGRIEFIRQCRDIRDIFGYPFRSVNLSPSCLTTEVVTLARAIYDSRVLDRLPELADALRSAGCNDATLLAHCREKGQHVRGCWVVDSILDRA